MTRRTAAGALASGLALMGASRFKGPLGLELYSLRHELEKDVPRTLERVSRMGFHEVEVPGFYRLTAAQFRKELEKAHLRATSMIAAWEDLDKNLPQVVDNARELSVQYIVCAWIPHKHPFTYEDARKAGRLFNEWGDKLKIARKSFCYHLHGYEFQKSADGTVADSLIKTMVPGIADFELDTFWVQHAGVSPSELLSKYPNRFPLVHLKDMAKGTPTGILTGQAPDEASVPLGTGMIDFQSFIKQAEFAQVKRFYIEDEHPNALEQIPASKRFIESVRIS